MGASEFGASIGVHPDYVRAAVSRAKKKANTGKTSVADIKQQNERKGKLATPEPMQEIILDFFRQETHVFSGDKRDTRRLTIPKQTLLQRFFAALP